MGQRDEQQFDEDGADVVASAGKPTKEIPGSVRQREAQPSRAAKIVKQEMTKVGKELQSAADDIWRRLAGQPVLTVRSALKRHPAFRDGPLNDKDLNAMAETIASGTPHRIPVR